MIVYLINMLLIGIWKLVFPQRSNRNKKIYITIVSIQFILIAGLRSLEIGSDTQRYAQSLSKANSMSFQELFHRAVVLMQTMNSEYRNTYFLIISKIVGFLFGYSYRIFLFVVAAVFMIALGKFFYSKSSDLCISYLLFAVIYFEFCLNATKQMLAIAAVSLIGYKYIEERKFWKFLLIQGIGLLFHASSIVFLPFYFLFDKGEKKYFHALMIAGGGFTVVFSKYIVRLFTSYGPYALYQNDTGGGAKSLMVFVGITIIIGIMFFLRKYTENRTYVISLTAIEIAMIFLLFGLRLSILTRLAYYYLPFLFVFVPEGVKVVKRNQQLGARAIIFLALVLMFILRADRHQYLFFWQG